MAPRVVGALSGVVEAGMPPRHRTIYYRPPMDDGPTHQELACEKLGCQRPGGVASGVAGSAALTRSGLHN